MTTFETYMSLEGDTVDMISFNRFGDLSGQVEAILAFNPGLADLGPILPLGTIVKLPIPVVQPKETVGRLWD